MKKSLKSTFFRKRDSRINAGLISLSMYFSVFATIYFLVVGQFFILVHLLENTITLIGVLVYYILVSGLLVTIIIGFVKRYVYGRPLQELAKAAQRITQGEFDVRVKSFRKDKKKDEIEVLIDDFNRMARELASVEILKNDFIANVSHEIRSPLTIIQSYSTALKNDNLSIDERNEYIDTIITATKNMSTMTANILSLNKFENQNFNFNYKSYHLGEQLRKCALLYIEQWQEKNIEFIIDVDEAIINGDEFLLEIVWNNLISNAVKFTQNGGRIAIEMVSNDKTVTVFIKDNGIGMSEEVLNHMFDKFYQGDPSHSTVGNGLGLALVKRILSNINGKIQVQSEEGLGTTIEVTLKKDFNNSLI